MMQKEGDKTIFTKHRNIWICGYHSHKTKKRIRLIRFILGSNHMENVKGRDDDSSESSYSAISHVSKPSSQEAGSGLKELVRGARAGVYTNGSTGRAWAWAWHGQSWGGCTPLAVSRPQSHPAQGQGWGVCNLSSGTFCTFCSAYARRLPQ